MNERKDSARWDDPRLREMSKSAGRFLAQLADDAEAVAALRIAVLNASEDAARTVAAERVDRFLLRF